MATSALDIFQHPKFDLAVTKSDDGALIFGATEVAKNLGVRDANTLVQSLPERYKGYGLVRTPGGDQRVWFITEPGLYQLLAQRQPSRIRNQEMRVHVEAFQAWVFEEVLPTLRKAHEHGIDAIGELKDRIAELELDNDLYKLSDEADPIRRRKSYEDGVRWGQANPHMRLASIYGYSPLEQG
ncbi:MAG TPA: BRO family protein [Beutenbergiaceae bacterium]|nr:BRO family protein [Beutenbergiaceae bacterium]